MTELVIDNFAGGGGASTGIEQAIGRSVDIAINHDPEALAMHEANHPRTRHYCEDVFAIDPAMACKGRSVGLAWFSPDCKHFSKAKGGKPVNKKIRGLAWVAVKWGATVKPRIIILENVEEFQTWGPLLRDGLPCPMRKGHIFRRFVGELEKLGYKVEWKVLRACDYGAPTIRKRLFLIARRDGERIIWPEPTHGEGQGLQPYNTAADCIDWSIPCPSIFDRKRPLAENTLRRIAKGIQRYVLDAAKPFIVPIAHYNGSTTVHDIDEPLRTITAHPKGGSHAIVVPSFVTYYGSGSGTTGRDLREPTPTVTTKDRFQLVTVQIAGESYVLTDIGMRMLQPRELYRAQGFHDQHIIDRTADGKPLTKEAQVRMCGNSVPPPFSFALVKANYMAPETQQFEFDIAV